MNLKKKICSKPMAHHTKKDLKAGSKVRLVKFLE